MSSLKISLYEMVLSLSSLIDLVSPRLVGHHKRVAYIAYHIASAMGVSLEEKNDITIASLLHDTGALSLKDRLDALKFDVENPHRHAELGYRLLHSLKFFRNAAVLVRYHHTDWNSGSGASASGHPVPFGSHIIHLADRVDTLIDHSMDIISQVPRICCTVRAHQEGMFVPELVDVFLELSHKESFWLDISYLPENFRKELNFGSIVLDLHELLEVARLFEKIIDFRSEFTATHSSGVSAVAGAMAKAAGLGKEDCLMMRIAGHLHDLGKIAIPSEILEKPDKLTKEEANVMKSHTYFTYQILDNIAGLETINRWASFHHEFLNGKGYPFHLNEEDLSLGSRLVSVADVFTAITEDRPYRKGIELEKALEIMHQMARNNVLDEALYTLLVNHSAEINKERLHAQEKAEKEYRAFQAAV